MGHLNNITYFVNLGIGNFDDLGWAPGEEHLEGIFLSPDLYQESPVGLRRIEGFLLGDLSGLPHLPLFLYAEDVNNFGYFIYYPVRQNQRSIYADELQNLGVSKITLIINPDGLGMAAILDTPFPLTDAALREKSKTGGYRVEFAWTANKCVRQDASGTPLTNIYEVGPGADPVPYTADKLLDGNRSSWDYTRNVEDDYWSKPYPTSISAPGTPWVIIDLSSGNSDEGRPIFNEIVAYFRQGTFPQGGIYHPGYEQFEIWGSSVTPPHSASTDTSPNFDAVDAFGNPVWTKLARGKVDALEDPFKWVLRFTLAQQRYLCIVFSRAVLGHSADPPAWMTSVQVTSLEVYYFQDETQHVINEAGSGPAVEITKSNDSTQVSISTPSECQITLENVSHRFSPGNSNSPIYGTLQYDGRGDGVRQGVPCRVYATTTTQDGVFHSERVFDGFIMNNQGEGGPQAIQTNSSSQEIVIVAKGILALAGNVIATPVYEGYRFDAVLRDFLDRSSVAPADTSIAKMPSALAYLVLDQTDPVDVFRNMQEALPLLEVDELHNPASIQVRDRGGRYISWYDFAIYKVGGIMYSGALVTQFNPPVDDITTALLNDFGTVVTSIFHIGSYHVVLLQDAGLGAPAAKYDGVTGGKVGDSVLSEYQAQKCILGFDLYSFENSTDSEKINHLLNGTWGPGGGPGGGNWIYYYNKQLFTLQNTTVSHSNGPTTHFNRMGFYRAPLEDPTQKLSWHQDFLTTGMSTIQAVPGSSVEPLGVVGYGNWVFMLSWIGIWPKNLPPGGSPGWPAQVSENAIECCLYLYDLDSGMTSPLLKKSLYTGPSGDIPRGFCPTTCIAANDTYFLYALDSFKDGVEYAHFDDSNYVQGGGYQSYALAWVERQSVRFKIWKHDGDPIGNGVTFIERTYFPFGNVDLEGSQYAGFVNYWVDGNILYCAAQPKKTSGTHRYEIWSVNLDAFYTGSATASRLAILSDNQGWGITDFFVNGNTTYVLVRDHLYVWDMTTAISQVYDFGPAFPCSPEIPEDEASYGYGTYSVNGYARKLSFPHFPHQLCGTCANHPSKQRLGGYQNNLNNYFFSTDWSDQFWGADSGGNPSTALDSDGGIWVLLGPFGGTDYSQARKFSRSTDFYSLNPVLVFNRTDGFVADMILGDGAPVANRLTFNPSPYKAGEANIALWTQQDDLTFPGNEKTTIEIDLETTSILGYGENVATRRYLSYAGKILWDQAGYQYTVTIEGLPRKLWFWGMATKCWIQVDNTGLGAFTFTGAIIYGQAVAQATSNSPSFLVQDDISHALYKVWYDKDITSPFSNDVHAAKLWLQLNSKSRLWLASLKLPWYPTLKPGDAIGITDETEGILDVPFKVLSVTTTGYQTEVTGRQLLQEDVQG